LFRVHDGGGWPDYQPEGVLVRIAKEHVAVELPTDLHREARRHDDLKLLWSEERRSLAGKIDSRVGEASWDSEIGIAEVPDRQLDQVSKSFEQVCRLALSPWCEHERKRRIVVADRTQGELETVKRLAGIRTERKDLR
jgi:hypothetical protein